MEINSVWDTNIAIYLLNGGLSEEAERNIQKLMTRGTPSVSIISEMELLGFKGISEQEYQNGVALLSTMTVLPLSNSIKDKTIEIKRSIKIKLPDAVIAATALVHGLTLLSRNEKDFLNIKGLKFVNPFRPQS